jgi:uncharacterized protein YcaQ
VARKPITISPAKARAIWLKAQKLDEAAPFGFGPAAAGAAVAHLGYVQIDTINVIERCHHHILYSRIPDYRRGDLAHLQSVDKSIFEYWTHALSYVPTGDLRFFRAGDEGLSGQAECLVRHGQQGRSQRHEKAPARGGTALHPRHRRR